MSLKASAAVAALTLAALAIPMAAEAHRPWLVPNNTSFSGEDPWVTVDAAISNDLFYADHNPMNLEQVSAIGPDGAKLPLENGVKGRYRSTFDVHLTQPGTTRVLTANPGGVTGTYVVDGKTYRLGGPARRPGPPGGAPGAQGSGAQGPGAQAPGPQAQGGPPPAGPGGGAGGQAGRPQVLPGVAEPSLIPANATDIKLVQSATRNETFITRGAPSAWKTTGVGLELAPGGTHPNDLVADEAATFKLILDGKPAAGAEVLVVAADTRFVNAPADLKLKADANGSVTVKWPQAGYYWISATAEAKGSIPNAVRRGAYMATFEVQKP